MEEKTGLFETSLRAIRERIRVEVPREEYLDRLAPEDRANILAILEKLEKQENPVGGRLVAFGGSVKYRDWKDIDLKLLTEKGVSVDVVNQKAIRAIKKLRRFDIKKGQVPVGKIEFEEMDCLYLSPKEGGKTIHLILSSSTQDAPAADMFAVDRITRDKFSQLCRF